VSWVEAAGPDAVVLTHCHMGINRGPSLGLAVLLSQGWDLVDALDAIRSARPVAWIAYAEDVLRWHHQRSAARPGALEDDLIRLARWRQDNELDLVDVIRQKRAQGY
jgi:protein-tyrosine phosphatase